MPDARLTSISQCQDRPPDRLRQLGPRGDDFGKIGWNSRCWDGFRCDFAYSFGELDTCCRACTASNLNLIL